MAAVTMFQDCGVWETFCLATSTSRWIAKDPGGDLPAVGSQEAADDSFIGRRSQVVQQDMQILCPEELAVCWSLHIIDGSRSDFESAAFPGSTRVPLLASSFPARHCFRARARAPSCAPAGHDACRFHQTQLSAEADGTTALDRAFMKPTSTVEAERC
jgi:hypothetical protein